MEQFIIEYYQTEMRHCLVFSVSTGIILIAVAVFMFVFFHNSTIIRSASITVSVVSLVFVFGGYFAGKAAEEAMPQKLQMFQSDYNEFIKNEVEKVETIHKNWLGIKIFWSAFILIGITLVFVSNRDIFIGLAIGLLIVGTIGLVEETKSMQHNERYRDKVIRLGDYIQCYTKLI